MDRRRALALLTGVASAAAGLVVGVPLLGQLLAPLRRRSGASGPDEISVGRLDDFPEGQPVRAVFPVTVRDGWVEKTTEQAAWILRAAGGVVALSGTCPHLGCAVKLRGSSDAFECPCHESEFGPDGEYRRGPARRGLDELPARVVGGEVRIRWVEFVAGISEQRPVRDVGE